MGLMSFPVVAAGSITETWDPTTNAREELGSIRLYRDSSGEFSLVQVVQLDNNGCNKGESLVQNLATLKGYSVTKSSTADSGCPFRGIAAASIASQRAGYSIIGGYVENAYVSQTTASGEYLMLSGSTAAQLSNDKASTFNTLQGTTTGSLFMILGRARAAVTTGLMSIQLTGVWV